ncbi:Oidioi.mRNA.OKI2018_I69.XSR.g14034.t1.cds [Oikopleura dioica]|uniref:Oidioi.mRNA.OKI2018_I69.XSR.g14034.t1.cds n=1 Tax=Oikopleura dioica TaxID=34765 RepID=A0ABN7SHC7_OIKDI|nr:Oidioi.mRNA.OKI2018_I69.XSR.g14034.t1.cds [Oikopleura dioica]
MDGGVSNKLKQKGSEQTSVEQKPLSVDQWFDNNPRRHKAQNKIKRIHERIPESCWAAYDRFLRTEGIQNDNEELLSKLENSKAESIYALRNNDKLYEARNRAELASVLFEEAQEQQDSVDQMRRELAHEKLVVSYGEVERTPVSIARKMKDTELELGDFKFEEDEEVPQVTNYAGSKGPRWRPIQHQGYGELFKTYKNRRAKSQQKKNDSIGVNDLKEFEQRRVQPSSFHFRARQGLLLQ